VLGHHRRAGCSRKRVDGPAGRLSFGEKQEEAVQRCCETGGHQATSKAVAVNARIRRSHRTVAYNASTQWCYNMSVAVARSLRQALLIRLGANALPLLWFHFPHRMIVRGCERLG